MHFSNMSLRTFTLLHYSSLAVGPKPKLTIDCLQLIYITVMEEIQAYQKGLPRSLHHQHNFAITVGSLQGNWLHTQLRVTNKDNEN